LYWKLYYIALIAISASKIIIVVFVSQTNTGDVGYRFNITGEGIFVVRH